MQAHTSHLATGVTLKQLQCIKVSYLHIEAHQALLETNYTQHAPSHESSLKEEHSQDRNQRLLGCCTPLRIPWEVTEPTQAPEPQTQRSDHKPREGCPDTSEAWEPMPWMETLAPTE